MSRIVISTISFVSFGRPKNVLLCLFGELTVFCPVHLILKQKRCSMRESWQKNTTLTASWRKPKVMIYRQRRTPSRPRYPLPTMTTPLGDKGGEAGRHQSPIEKVFQEHAKRTVFAYEQYYQVCMCALQQCMQFIPPCSHTHAHTQNTHTQGPGRVFPQGSGNSQGAICQ